jgi:hypothetical protein
VTVSYFLLGIFPAGIKDILINSIINKGGRLDHASFFYAENVLLIR